MKTIRKLKRMLLTLVLMGLSGSALMAQTNWAGETISTNTTKSFSGTVLVNGTINVNGCTLTINNTSTTAPLYIKRNFDGSAGTSSCEMFRVSNGGKVIIHESEATRVIFDGNNYAGVCFNITGSELDFQYVTIQKMKAGNVNLSGVAINVISGSATATVTNLVSNITLDYVTIDDCGDAKPTEYSLIGKGHTNGAICTGTYAITYLTITNCRFTNNRSTNAYAGILKNGGPSAICVLNMDHCYVSDNYSSGWGGFMLWSAGNLNHPIPEFPASKATITNCIFENNEAAYLGGAISNEGTIELTDNIFRNNRAAAGGAIATFPFTLTTGEGQEVCGLQLRGGNEFYDNASTMDSVDFHPVFVASTTNTARYNVGGGAIWCFMNLANATCTLNILNEDIHDNTTVNERPGGGVYVCTTDDVPAGATSLVIGDTLGVGPDIHSNLAGKGGGVALENADLVINAGHIYENGYSIDDSDIETVFTAQGGGVYINGGSIEIKGGTIEDNKANAQGGGFYVTGDSEFVLTIDSVSVLTNHAVSGEGGGFYLENGNIVITDSDISGNTSTYNGGGFFANNGTVSISDSTTVNNNTSFAGNGGAFFARSNVTVDASEVAGNTAVNGGGFYVASGADSSVQTLIHNGTKVDNNNAANGAGAYVESGILKILDNGTQVNGNVASTSGGGIYMANGTVTFTNAKMQDNTATNNDGGGLYLGNGTMMVSGANAAFTANKAKNRGGGVYVGGGSFTMTGGAIGGPYSVTTTDSICPAGQPVVYDFDTIVPQNDTTIIFYDTIRQGNYTMSSAGYGGGLYMNAGTATLTGGSISGNYTNEGYGGGIYMNGGTCTLSGGATIGGSSLAYANNAKYGGGICSANGSITVEGGVIDHNTATDGGGIYSNGPEATVKITKEGDALSYMRYNTATNGGGIYANRGSVEFTDGNILYNHASEAGGGMYVNDEGTLYLKGNATLSGNHVPEGHHGGGVYLIGKVVVGEESSKALGSINAQDNYAGDTYQYDILNGLNNRNNIYLPEPQNPTVLTSHKDVITVIEDGIDSTSHVGFSVPRNYVPVIYCKDSGVPSTVEGYTSYTTSQYFLHQFSTGMKLQRNLFDDTERYEAVHYVGNPVFDQNHVYLYGFWTNIVVENPDPTVLDTIGDIDTPEKLAYFISWVNGINDCIGRPHPDAVGNITADIDMSAFGWVPIGTVDTADYANSPGFQGVLNGNGHTITGITSLLNEDHMAYGIVGLLKGGTIKDLFVKDAEYALEYKDGLVVGGLVGDAYAGTIENREVSCEIVANHPTTIVGGLVGRTGNDGSAPTIHSAIGIATLHGFEMGGLVGRHLKGDLLNSFANTRFDYKGTTQYTGGLVAVNRGTVENCYARLRGSAPTGNFGILVGDNTGGTVNYCYAPAGMTNYKKTGNAPTGHGNYAVTELPYLYRHRDTQVTLAEGVDGDDNAYLPEDEYADRQMMVVLNEWVRVKNGATGEHPTYTKWGRPWQASDALKPINDDYPVLRMPLANAVASSDDDPYLDYNDIDVLLAGYQSANEAIWMYANDEEVTGNNSASAAKLYIDEHVALVNTDTIKAYVGITLDNSAGANGVNPTYFPDETDETDWHMVSTSLSNAPVGIDYTDGTAYPFAYGHPTGMPYYRFYPKDDAKHGYFPSHRYGTEYPMADNTLEGYPGNYYTEWDFYSYYEPEYHWINFKRNSASHHHMDYDGHESIDYHNGDTLGDGLGNESRLVPGKGYFAATREETLLQCYGTLNHEEVDYVATRTSGVPRHGYNLLGNPFQAYLDFDQFARGNYGDDDAIWDDTITASYTILDEDEPVTGTMVETILGRRPVYYRTYAFGCSSNADVSAGGFIHPHQGFFVRLDDRDNAVVYFFPNQRNATDTVGSKFRGAREKVDYPLVNLFAMEDNGHADVVTVELGRPDSGGALLMQGLRTGNGKIWCHYNDKDYTIAFTQPGVTEVPIRFETVEDTEYTLTWNTLHGEFGYMHLIDNKTGADVDCLATDRYRFSAKTTDYTSRFKLVFGYTGIEEDTEAEANENFAFMMNDELVVTGEGVLQVFDVTGRMVMSQELHGVQTTVSLPAAANGVYVLRLTEGKQSRIQKMVISK